MKRVSALVAVLVVVFCAPAAATAQDKFDTALALHARHPQGVSRVIVTTVDGKPARDVIESVSGIPRRFLGQSVGQVALVPDERLEELARHPQVASIRLDRAVAGSMERAAGAVGATWIREQLGFTGKGIGVAIIDSGVADWHDDLGAETVIHFADFVSDLPIAHDDYGHGTHVAGTIAGSGFDSGGARRGIAPEASLIVLKVLDEGGQGHISDVIAAIDYAVENRTRFNIRVINLSVASGVYESFTTDPLALAAKRAVDAGIVVVTAAGNLGRNARGAAQSGGITSPGNAPWVITVGAANHQKTVSRIDDTIAPFSSRGPTHIDRAMKPDLVAPGVAIESLAAPGSTLYDLHPDARIRGTIDTAHAPYISLTGTSMAVPLVTGTIALMLEANPRLTPNLVKGILHYTAERRARVELIAQGAGLLNARGAVQLALSLGDGSEAGGDPTRWSRQILWGSQRVRGGTITVDGNAWRADVVWGAAATPEGQRIVWGTAANAEAPWGASRRDDDLNGEEPGDDIASTWSDAPQLVWAATVSAELLTAHDETRPHRWRFWGSAER